ncbi:hypothetical protein HYU95_00570 [Candidatus Daviesbacteria bacterium]|nr:hypothetical protein [Candidatus Daviesbacteria bacterium]
MFKKPDEVEVRQRRQKGNILIPVIVAGIILVGLAGFLFTKQQKESKQDPDQKPVTDLIEYKAPQKEEDKAPSFDPLDLRDVWSRGKCQGKGMIQFGTLPMKPEDFSVYLPYGLVTDAHVTPIDHGYFSPTVFNSPRDTYEVRAIADGVIVRIETREKQVNESANNQAKAPEYRLDIEHTCDLYSYFDLITSLSPEIKAELEKAGKYFAGRIPIKEGQLIGRIGGQTLDFAVYNNTLRLNFVNPKSYEGETWKIHTDDPFKYFKEPARSILISKNARKAEPLAGKIDYDIDGKLVGNWFEEGTNGYAGKNMDRYWDGHFSIAYDYIDPTQIRFSIGNFDGKAAQFGVKDNSPDPATVDKSFGIVKYELTQFEYYDKSTGQGWSSMQPIKEPSSRNTNYLGGTALLQLLEGRKLKLEVFPGKTANQVSGFTQNAKIYER